METHEAQLNITFAGENGDFPDPVSFDATDADIKMFAEEAIRGGSIPGIGTHQNVDFTDFVVMRHESKDGNPNKIFLRPKTPFGL